MAPSGVSAKIAEAKIEGDEGTVILHGGGENVLVRSSYELLISDRVDLVTEEGKGIASANGDVLVELEPHLIGDSGLISCLASQAPWASAARMPSIVRLG